MGLVAKAFQDIITFSRSTQTGTYVNSNGYITNSSVLNYLTYSNQPENAAWTKSNSFVQQNLLIWSEQFDNANWGPSGVSTPTANTTIAPDGTLTADTVTATASTTQHLITQTTSGLTATPITISIYAKANTHNFLQIFHGALATNYANFNISTGVVGTVGAGFTSASMNSVGNGWFRCIVTLTPTATSNVRIALVTSNTAVYNESWTTVGTESVYLWGAQCVQGSVPGDYRATTTAALPCLYADYNGALRARKFCEAATTGTHSILQNNTITGGVIATNSIYVKAAERTQCRVINYDNAANYAFVYVNLSNGSIVSSGITGTVSSQSFSVEPAENGWYRISVAASLTSTTRQLRVDTAVGGSESTTGDGSSGIYIADAQLNDGSSALAYYETTASAYNAPRFDYDPVTLAAKGLLVEEQRVNLLLQSNDFATTWTPISVTITQNSTLSPDGNVNADTVAASATAVGSRIQQDLVVSTTSQYVYSCYVRPGTVNTVSLSLYNNTTATALATVNFNVSTGVVVTTTVGSGTITPAGYGWYRCIVTHSGTVTATNSIRAYVYPNNTSGTTGDSVIIYGSQVEAGAFATSYIPTVASQVTRAADVASVNTLSPWYNSVAGTLFVSALRSAVNPTAASSVFEIGDGTNNNRYLIYNPSAGTTSEFFVSNGGVAQAQINVASAFQVNVAGKVAGAYQANDFQQASNGTLGTADTSGTLPTVTAAYIGRNGAGTVFWGGWIQRITYYPRRLTNAELQTLTTL